MKVWTTTAFAGHCINWPVKTAAVVVADTQQAAYDLLMTKLAAAGLGDQNKFSINEFKPTDVIELDTSKPVAVILADGNY